MARLNDPVYKTRSGRKIDGGLRDIISWLGVNLLSKFGALLLGTMRADQHPVTP
jgi:hypothetical protein